MDAAAAIVAARAELPFWVVWGGLGFVILFSFVLPVTIGRLAVRVALAPSAQVDSWVERARLLWGLKQALAFSVVLLFVVLEAFIVVFGWPFSAVPQQGLAVAAGIGVLAAASIVWRQGRRHLRLSKKPLGVACRDGAIVFLLYLFPWVVAYWLAPSTLNLVDCATLVGVILVTQTGALTIVVGRALSLIRPASARLARVVAVASTRIGVTPRATYELAWSRVNAFALLLTRAVAVTDGALSQLTDEELEAFCAHEFGHLQEPLSSVLLRVSLRVTIVVLIFLLWPLRRDHGPVALLVAAGALSVALTWNLRLTQRAERAADRIAQSHEGAPGALARALEKAHRFNLTPVVLGRRHAHPDLYDRMLAAGVEPAYPRPAPPSRRGLNAAAVVCLCIAAAQLCVPIGLVRWQRPEAELMMTSCPSKLSRLAHERLGRSDYAAAVSLARANSALHPASWWIRNELAQLLALTGHCAEARTVLAEAVAGARAQHARRWRRIIASTSRQVETCAGPPG